MAGMWSECSSLASNNIDSSILDVNINMSTLTFFSQQALDENMDLLEGITGFEDSVRKCKSLSEPGGSPVGKMGRE